MQWLPFATYESRSAGMGITGIASSNIAAAPFINPAMLAAQRFEEDFSFMLGAGIQVLDNENLLGDIEAFNDAINSGNAAAYNAAALNASGKRLDLIGTAQLMLVSQPRNGPGLSVPIPMSSQILE